MLSKFMLQNQCYIGAIWSEVRELFIKSMAVMAVFSSVQFSFISAPPHEQNNKMLKSLCVAKDGVRKRKKQQNELTLCLAN